MGLVNAPSATGFSRAVNTPAYPSTTGAVIGLVNRPELNSRPGTTESLPEALWSQPTAPSLPESQIDQMRRNSMTESQMPPSTDNALTSAASDIDSPVDEITPVRGDAALPPHLAVFCTEFAPAPLDTQTAATVSPITQVDDGQSEQTGTKQLTSSNTISNSSNQQPCPSTILISERPESAEEQSSDFSNADAAGTTTQEHRHQAHLIPLSIPVQATPSVTDLTMVDGAVEGAVGGVGVEASNTENQHYAVNTGGLSESFTADALADFQERGAVGGATGGAVGGANLPPGLPRYNHTDVRWFFGDTGDTGSVSGTSGTEMDADTDESGTQGDDEDDDAPHVNQEDSTSATSARSVEAEESSTYGDEEDEDEDRS